jgi:hypothetical protein
MWAVLGANGPKPPLITISNAAGLLLRSGHGAAVRDHFPMKLASYKACTLETVVKSLVEAI